MASITKWSPFSGSWGDPRHFDWDLGRFFREFMGGEEMETAGHCPSPAVESYRHDGSYVVKVDLPGVNPRDIHLTFEDGYLTIEGERKRGEEVGESSVLREEVCYGAFRRSLYIPEGINSDQIKAKYHDGVLEITAPIDQRFLPKRIEVEEVKA